MATPIMVHRLSEEERADLETLRKKTKSAHQRSRCEMILYSTQGLRAPEIARRVPYSDDTVGRVIAAYEARGLAGLFRKKAQGPVPKVNASWLAELEAAMGEDPRDLGLPFSTWSCARLGAYLAEGTGIWVSARTVERHLKAHRWRLRRPAPSVHHKQDPQEMAKKGRS